MGSRPARRHSRSVKARARTKAERAQLRLGERERWLEGERDWRRSTVDRSWAHAGRVLGVALLVAGTLVFGVASLAAAAPAPPCGPAVARPGDSVAGFVYQWGMSWRNMADVWRVAQANPAMPNPNVLAVGQLVVSCPEGPGLHASVPVAGHGLAPGETFAGLESVATGGWHWPIPVWELAQANPGFSSPFAALPAGTLVHLLAASPAPSVPRETLPPPSAPVVPSTTVPVTFAPVVIPPVVVAPPVTDPPTTEGPAIVTSSPTTSAAPDPTTVPTTPPTSAAPATTAPASPTVPDPAPAPTVPVLPPATLPPDPPKLTSDPPTTQAPDPGRASEAGAAPPRVFGGELPAPSTTVAPVPVAPSALVALADKIGGPGWDGPDPTVVAGYWRVFGTALPSLSPEGLSYLLGSIQQESDFNPTSHNVGEGAWGLIQAEGGRCVNVPHTALAESACVVDELTSPVFSGGPAKVDPGPVLGNALTLAEGVAAKTSVLPILSTPGLDHQLYRAAIKLYEGYGKEGRRTDYAERIWQAVSK